jgi:hypothetical protein
LKREILKIPYEDNEAAVYKKDKKGNSCTSIYKDNLWNIEKKSQEIKKDYRSPLIYAYVRFFKNKQT